MAKHIFHNNHLLAQVFAISMLLFMSNQATCQNSDSSKIKKSNATAADTAGKYGYANITLLGHVRKVALPALKDSDGDGVPDMLDLEPNTPPRVEVDSHGRAIDTDGDGVPDYKDKEKLTPQRCFPVDSNGVGVCPEAGCCWEFAHIVRRLNSLANGNWDSVLCSIPFFPDLETQKAHNVLDKQVMRLIDSTVIKIHWDGDIKIRYYGLVDGTGAQLQLDEVNLIAEYISKKTGHAQDRIIIDNLGEGKRAKFIDIVLLPIKPI